jgi:hypothetical protein
MAGTDPNSVAGLTAQAQGTAGASPSQQLGGAATPVNDINSIAPGTAMYGGPGNVLGPENYGKGGYTAPAPKGTQVTVNYWLNYFYSQIATSPQARQQFATEAELANLVGPNANVPQLYSAWQKLIVEAYNYGINKQDVTPWDILANSIPGTQAGTYTENNGQSAMQNMTSQQAADIAAKAAAQNTQKQTQGSEVDINYTDPDTARYVLNQASQQLLGRNATNAEIAKFTTNLNNDERLFPKMTQDTKTAATSATSATTLGAGTSDVGGQGQTIVSYDAQGNPVYGSADPTTTNTSTGNTTDTVVSLGEQDYTRYGRQQLAEDAAKSSPDYGAYQAAGPLFQAFLGALKSAVPGVGSNQ